MQVGINLHPFALTYEFGFGFFSPVICMYLLVETYASEPRPRKQTCLVLCDTFTDKT